MEVTVDNCEKEPIHIPGAIQEFGFFLGVAPDSLAIRIASENTASFLGIAHSQLLKQTLHTLFSQEQLNMLNISFEAANEESQVVDIYMDKIDSPQTFKAVIHLQHQLLCIELEPLHTTPQASINISKLNQTFKAIAKTRSVQEFCQITAENVREITGFDRVMIYRFKTDASGEVIAEARKDSIEPFLGLHYPASDIPSQAREMYKRSLLRFIPDVHYQPVNIQPRLHPDTAQPLDMTYAILRSVSPIHIKYLKNMGVSASMSISLMKDDQLWGLIACHHYSPHLIDYDRREFCQLIGRTFSAMIADKELKENQDYHLHIREAQKNLFHTITGQENFSEALRNAVPLVQELFQCSGAAVCLDNQISLSGQCPDEAQIVQLVEWLQHYVGEDIFHTNQLAAIYPEGESIKELASGLLTISISKVQGDYILWFRPEVVQTVSWAGNPQKAIQISESGTPELSPRNSFEAWKELVEGKSIAWQEFELEISRELRTFLVDILLQVAGELKLRADILSRLNNELEESNSELDSFAYIASHDLKEPLRGIHNYATFLLEDYEDKLGEDGKNKLHTLVRLSMRIRSLVDSLFEFSRIGRLSLSVSETNMQTLVEEVIDLLHFQLAANQTEVVIKNQLPTIECDRIRVPEVFNNLVTNAIKYNTHGEKVIEIGSYLTSETDSAKSENIASEKVVFYVKDNGIGIDPKFFDTIFQMFKRLNPVSKYGEGSGVGLAIVKKIVEKHGGSIWLDSEPEQGTTFYFTFT